MRVGFFLTNSSPASGGEYVFQNVIYEVLKAQATRHQFSFFFDRLDAKAVRETVDVIWFITPFHELIEDIPFITTLWDLQHRVQPYFPEVGARGNWQRRELLHGTLLPRASYIVVGTEAGKKEIVNFYRVPEARIKVLPFPAPPKKEFNPNTAHGDDEDICKAIGLNKPFLFYPAQFWAHKNHVRILQAIKRLKEEYGLGFSAVFTGSDKGNAAYIHHKAIEMGIKEDVYFLGFVPQAALDCLYRKAFALVFPTFFGPDNLPPLEAFSWGCPVIASDIAGASEQLGNAVLWFDPKSEAELVYAILRLYKDPCLKGNLVEAGYRRNEQIGTANDYVRKMIEVIDEFEPIRQCWSS